MCLPRSTFGVTAASRAAAVSSSPPHRPFRPSLLDRLAGPLRRRFAFILLLLGVISVGAGLVASRVDTELNGIAKRLDLAGSLRYRLLELSSRQRAPHFMIADNQRAVRDVVNKQRATFATLIQGDPSQGVPPCLTPEICARLEAHRQRWEQLADGRELRNASALDSGLPEPAMRELYLLDETVSAMVGEVERRIVRVVTTGRLAAVATVFLLLLGGYGVWDVFARIERVKEAAGSSDNEPLHDLSGGTDEVAALAGSLERALHELKVRADRDRRRVDVARSQQHAAHQLARGLDTWLGDREQPPSLGELAAVLGFSTAWVDIADGSGGYRVVVGDNLDRDAWRATIVPSYRRDDGRRPSVTHIEGFGWALLTPLRMASGRSGTFGLRADHYVELSEHRLAFVSIIAQNLSVSVLAARLLEEREHREAIASLLATLSDLGKRCEEIAFHLNGLIPFDAAALAVLNDSGRVAQTWRLSLDGSGGDLQGLGAVQVPPTSEITVASGHPIGALLTDNDSDSMLLVPLRAAGKSLGLLTLIRGIGEFSTRDQEVGVAVAALLSSVRSRMMVEGQVRSSEQLAAFDGFSRMLAHEIRNPLNSLSLHAQLLGRKLAREGLTPEQQGFLDEHLGVIGGEIRRLDTLVGDFLALSRADVSVSTELVDLRTLTREAIDVHRPTFAEHTIELAMELGPEPAYARIKVSRIQQILHNLVKNAIDALSGTEIRALFVQVSRSETTVEVHVRDTGPGVVDDQKIFSPTFTTKPGGGGMGLPVSRQIARLHGGHLHVLRSEQQGAEFVLSLPAAAAPRPVADVESQRGSA